jgi:hypothetical protein
VRLAGHLREGAERVAHRLPAPAGEGAAGAVLGLAAGLGTAAVLGLRAMRIAGVMNLIAKRPQRTPCRFVAVQRLGPSVSASWLMGLDSGSAG